MATISPERRAALAKEKAHNSGSSGFLKLATGPNVIRLIPLADNEYYGTKVVTYFINKRSFICNMETHGRPGVIAKTIDALSAMADPQAQELVAGLKKNRSSKYYAKAIDRTNPEQVVWAQLPWNVYKYIRNLVDIDGEAVDDAEEGVDFRIMKSGSGMTTSYDIRPLKPSPLAEDERVLKNLLTRASRMHIEDVTRPDEQGAYEALADTIPKDIWKKIRADVAPEATDDAGDGDEAAPAKKPSKVVAAEDDDDEAAPAPVKKAAKVVAEEDDDEPAPAPAKKPAKAVVDAEDDDEAAPAPVKKAAKPVDDDDDEVVPVKKPAKAIVEEDDDEPAPPKRPNKKYTVTE